MIHGDVIDIELPEQVDVIVSEWLGGFGIDEGMLAPVIAARDRWLKPGGVMIPHTVTAWTALVHDRYLADMIEFLREDPFGLKLEVLVEKTVNEIIYSGTFRHLAADDLRSEPRRLWTTNADRIPLEQAQAPHHAETLLPVHDHGTANALALWFSAELAPGISLSVGPGDPPTHWGMTTAPLRSAVQLTPGIARRRQSQDRPGATDGDMDTLGDRNARRRLGGARRAVSLGGNRRLSTQERCGRGSSTLGRLRPASREPDDALDDHQHAEQGESPHSERVCMAGDPGRGSLDRTGRPIWCDQEADERDLEQPEHDQVEADHQQHRHRRRVVQLVDLIKSGEVRGARQGQEHPDQECGPRQILC